MTELIANLADLRHIVSQLRQKNKKIALVPTMGALHDGHMSLVKMGFDHADCVIATIFVNPAQFGAHEDFDRYPRPLSADIEKLAQLGANFVYAPKISEIYPSGFGTEMSVKKLGDNLCGRVRPGHFNGVVLVVAKLFNQAMPDIAIFGEKDFQQLTIIRKMAKDLDFNIKILGAPTVRETDGLAMSSRNAYLTAEERKIAPKLFEIISWGADSLRALQNPANILPLCAEKITQAGFQSIDYCDWRDSETLDMVDNCMRPSRLIVAAQLGKARLLDNVQVI